MNLDMARAFTEERRARLAAERLLEMRQADLQDVRSRLSRQGRTTTAAILENREEVSGARTETEALRVEYTRIVNDLERASQAADRAERQLWQALQTVRDGFAIFDRDGHMVVANKAYLAPFDGLAAVGPGATYAEVLQALADEGIVNTEGPAADWVAMMQSRWNRDAIPPVVMRLWNGQIVKVLDQRTPEGGIVTLGINQTDTMRMWEAVETIPDGFVLYDADDRMVMCNARFREIYRESASILVPGVAFEDILRHGLTVGTYPDAKGREEEWLQRRLTAHRDASIVVEQQMGDGTWLRVVDRPTADGGRVGLRIDITSIKEHQAALVVERERAETANRAKSAFLANMSHEIRTPMNGVVGMADLLAETALNEEQRLFVETIRGSGQALLQILNDVLDFSKIEADRLVLRHDPFDLESCIHEVLMLLRPQVQAKKLDLILDYDLFLPTQFVGDAGRVRQVLTNLVGNAVKFTPSGHILIRVVGSLDETAGDRRCDVHVTVEDTGIGIPADKIEHVFGKFNQVEDARNRAFEGTGLGLAICSQLTGLMGGRIWVESEENAGACFGFSMPLPLAPDAHPHPLRAPAAHRRAVVVDRPSAARQILLRQLSLLGPEVVPIDESDLRRASLGAGDAIFVSESALGDDAPATIAGLRAAGVSGVFLVTRGLSDPRLTGTVSTLVDAVLPWPLPRLTLCKAMSRRPDAGVEPDTQATAAAGPPTVAASTALATAPRLRVLAAEDNRTNQLVLRKMLQDQPIDLEVVGNGAEAVDAFMQARPDLILMDISMPGMDGKEATRRIRAAEATSGARPVTIVAMTAHAMSGDAEDIMAACLDHYLTKPLRKAELIEHITAVADTLRNAAADGSK
jgi:hypothetical protein